MTDPAFHPESPRRPRRLRRALVVMVVLALAGGVGYATLQKPASDATSEKDKDKDGKPKTDAALVFSSNDVVQAEARSLARSLAISGSLQPLTQSLLKSKASGEVRQVTVREGETVARGQLLVTIDTVDLNNRLEAAQADLEERRARLSIALRNRETNEALLKRNFISQSAFDQTQSTWQGAEAAVRGGEAQVRLARTAVEDAMVRSPLAGIVAKRHVNVGERVGPESPLLNIVDLTRLELEVTVPASDIGEVSIGQPVRFAVDGYGSREFTGRVARINPVAEPGSRAIKLFIDVPNADQALKGGMFAQGALVLAQGPSLPVVPGSAIIEEAGQGYVFVIKDGKIDKRAVKRGMSDAATGQVALESGVATGETVVRIRMNGLKAGSAAAIKG